MEAMSAPSGIRIGNDERNAAIKALDEHLNAGRLDAEEYGQRVAQASVARTREGLDELFVDLPQPHPFPAQAQQWRGVARPPAAANNVLRRFAGESTILRIALLVVAAAVIVAVLPFAIVAAVLFFVVFPMLGCGGWRHGPRPIGRFGARRRW